MRSDALPGPTPSRSPPAAAAPCLPIAGAARPRRDALWLALFFPALPLEAFAPAGERGPLAVVEGSAARARVLAADAAAMAEGVRPGDAAAGAVAHCPRLCLLRRAPEAERAVLAGAAAVASRFTPRVSLLDGPGLVLEIGASLALFGGLGRLCAALEDALAGLGLEHRRGVAPTPLAAWWLARAGIEAALTDPARLPDRLAPVALEHTDLEPRQCARLAAMGVRTLGQCNRLPRDGLVRRLGPGLLHRLDQAYGRRPDPRSPHRLAETFERLVPLAAAVSERGPLMLAAGRALEELCALLGARAEGVSEITLHLVHRSGHATRVTVGASAPTRDPGRLLSLLRERMERLALPSPVEAVGMRAGRFTALAPASGTLFEHPEEHAEEARVLVERLRARLGRAVVYALAVRADHRPERAWVAAAPGPGLPCADPSGGGEDTASTRRRPLWLLEHPPVLAAPGGIPSFEGRRLRLLCGPERIETGWWEPGAEVARDYYVAAGEEGALYWVYRERRDPRGWYLHGLFG